METAIIVFTVQLLCYVGSKVFNFYAWRQKKDWAINLWFWLCVGSCLFYLVELVGRLSIEKFKGD